MGACVLLLVLLLRLMLLLLFLLPDVVRPGCEVLVQRAELHFDGRELREILRIFGDEIQHVSANIDQLPVSGVR